MRLGLESAGAQTVWANDIEADKWRLYTSNFGEREAHLGDIRDVSGRTLPDAEIATASFPCTDLSLAGDRRGLGLAAAPKGTEGGSSMFWEFSRVMREMGDRRPSVVLLENVLGFASSHGGHDLRAAVRELNDLGYSCDLFAVDARHFVPQSRPRMFIVGLTAPDPADVGRPIEIGVERPSWVGRLMETAPDARLHFKRLPPLPSAERDLAEVVERLKPSADDWWDADRFQRFVDSLSPIQTERFNALRDSTDKVWRTAYRRTRNGVAVWEIRADRIAGCLRTARGGSSKQALVEAGRGEARVRWMTPREYARLMGAPDFRLADSTSKSLFGFGDAVCVPVVSWICEHYVVPAGRAAASDPLARAA